MQGLHSVQRTMLRCYNMAARLSEPVTVLASNVYISEGRDAAVIEQLQHAASSSPGVLLARVFVDPAYHRTGFTLTSTSPSQLAQGVVHLSQTALSCLDLRQHSATHPRLGVVDHISLHPLHPPHPSPSQAPTPQQHPGPGPPSPAMAAAVQCGLAVAAALSQPPWLLPVFLYGALQAEGRRLADTRRGLGYFQAPAQGACWSGALPLISLSHFPPDMGPQHVTPHWGLVTLGAVPWVVNYNVPVAASSALKPAKASPQDAPPPGGKQGGPGEREAPGGPCQGQGGVLRAGPAPALAATPTPTPGNDINSELAAERLLPAARHVARRLSARGGGLPHVEVRLHACSTMGGSGGQGQERVEQGPGCRAAGPLLHPDPSPAVAWQVASRSPPLLPSAVELMVGQPGVGSVLLSSLLSLFLLVLLLFHCFFVGVCSPDRLLLGRPGCTWLRMTAGAGTGPCRGGAGGGLQPAAAGPHLPPGSAGRGGAAVRRRGPGGGSGLPDQPDGCGPDATCTGCLWPQGRGWTGWLMQVVDFSTAESSHRFNGELTENVGRRDPSQERDPLADGSVGCSGADGGPYIGGWDLCQLGPCPGFRMRIPAVVGNRLSDILSRPALALVALKSPLSVTAVF
ncbi:Formiminotransferase subdomain-containing protein [Haematococcus lacustris]